MQIRFAAVHVLKDGSEPEAHVVGAHFFAFDKRETDTEDRDADWSNVQTAIASDIGMETGQYRPMQFAFTKPGVYRVQVNVQGHVRKERPTGHTGEWERISPDDTITSPVQWYTFHVGDLADLGVAVEASDPAPEVETDLTLTVTASNAGPNAAEVTEVQVNLPEGLTYSSHDTASGTYDSATGVWSVGSMEAPTGDDPTEATLTITVSAAANTQRPGPGDHGHHPGQGNHRFLRGPGAGPGHDQQHQLRHGHAAVGGQRGPDVRGGAVGPGERLPRSCRWGPRGCRSGRR